MHFGLRFEKWRRLVEISSVERVSQLAKVPPRVHLRHYLHLQCLRKLTADPCPISDSGQNRCRVQNNDRHFSDPTVFQSESRASCF